MVGYDGYGKLTGSFRESREGAFCPFPLFSIP